MCHPRLPLAGELYRPQCYPAEYMNQFEVGVLGRSEMVCAVAVLASGMRDNPLHVRAFGEDPHLRETALARMFAGLLPQYASKGVILGAFDSGTLVGVCGMVQPGRCEATTIDKLRLLPALLAGGGLRSTVRVVRWVSRWSRHDPTAAHRHLGPVAVERHLQGKGIGSVLLRQFCTRMDAEQSVAYLETEKPENVTFYKHFGFQATAQDQVLGVPNWFMSRGAQSEAR